MNAVGVPLPEATHEERRRRLIVESVELAAPGSDAGAIVDDALAMAGRTEVPAIAEGYHVFLTGHLLDAIESHAGAEASDRFEESIEVLVRAAAALHESAPAPSRGNHGRLVMVASSSSERIATIARALAKHADVEAVSDPEALAALVWAELASAIVIDWTDCPLDAAEIDELAASMAEGGRLVLWGAPTEVEERFLEAKRAKWLSCARTAPAGHVASIVLALLAID